MKKKKAIDSYDYKVVNIIDRKKLMFRLDDASRMPLRKFFHNLITRACNISVDIKEGQAI